MLSWRCSISARKQGKSPGKPSNGREPTGTGSCTGRRTCGSSGRRTGYVKSCPGYYDTSSAGHIPAGAEPLPSALRELKEELGLDARPEELIPAGTFRIRYEKEFHGRLFRDNEFTFVYVYAGPVDEDALVLQESEVDEVRWFPLGEVREEIRVSRRRFCVPFEGLELLCAFLEKRDGIA